jgi:N utilization substance protein B
MGVRRQAREAALQILYLVDIAKLKPEAAAEMTWAGGELPPKAREFSVALAQGALDKKAELDAAIVKYAENWELHRMAAVDRNILRLAAFELLHHPETPVSVVIDEAVEIAKHYSTQDSGKFVNGILDKIKLERPPAPEGTGAAEAPETPEEGAEGKP